MYDAKFTLYTVRAEVLKTLRDIYLMHFLLPITLHIRRLHERSCHRWSKLLFLYMLPTAILK